MSAGKETVIYKSFEQLFNDAGNNIPSIKALKPNKTRWYAAYSFFNLEFNIWLVQKCGWDGDPSTYERFLTKDFFIMFMQYIATQEKELKDTFKKEEQSWEINSSEPAIEYTHRQYAIAQYFKEKTGADPLTPKQKRERGKNFELAYNKVTKPGAIKRPFLPRDIKAAIMLLANDPPAQLAAKQYLEEL